MGISRILQKNRQEGKSARKKAELKIIDLARHDKGILRLQWSALPRTPILKEAVDRCFALVALLFLLPFFAIVAVAIRLTSAGPIIYRQVRIGINRRTSIHTSGRPAAYYDVYDRRTLDLPGKPFIIYKFRTMVDGAEDKVGPTWAGKDDPRITLLGNVLRRLRIDETPQFLNVLKGDMGLVGPRPERPTFVRDLIEEIPEYAIRLRVKPGITGLAQVEHHYDTCLDDVRTKLKFDLEYIRNIGPLRDMKILVRTVWVVLTMKGSH